MSNHMNDNTAAPENATVDISENPAIAIEYILSVLAGTLENIPAELQDLATPDALFEHILNAQIAISINPTTPVKSTQETLFLATSLVSNSFFAVARLEQARSERALPQ